MSVRQSSGEAGDFTGLLFRTAAERAGQGPREAPACFHDLHLDQIAAAVTAGWEEYDLLPIFQAPLRDVDAVAYRQDVMRDLERAPVMDAVKAFSGKMRAMREHLGRAEKSAYAYEKALWFLNAAATYGEAVGDLGRDLDRLEPASRGMVALQAYLAAYTASDAFRTLLADAERLSADLSAIRYTMHIKGRTVSVRRYDGEADYSLAVERTFEKFRRGAARSYLARFPETGSLNHVEAQVLEGVARLNPAVFQALDAFCRAHASYLDAAISQVDREIQFYVAYLTYIERFRHGALSFCYPQMSATSKEVSGRDVFDLALAGARPDGPDAIVPNDFFLRGPERIFVVSGPNQGGKTTFARMFGQLHYLGSLGCPVPGTTAQLFLVDRIFTHFERAEEVGTQRGKLQDDLIRIRGILDEATPNSLVIMNEVFSSTTLPDAIDLSRKVMAAISRLDALGVWVTFLTELASFDEKTVSLVSLVDPRDPAIRTYKVRRRPADGLSYALSLAEKYRVTHGWLKERIRG
jgi:DNA mismatch repair protein MutS